MVVCLFMPFFLVRGCLFVHAMPLFVCMQGCSEICKGHLGDEIVQSASVHSWDAIHAMAKILGFQPSGTTGHELLSRSKMFNYLS
jgi:hypothetical protein